MAEVKIKRAYEEASRDDGFRIFVDRLWPRGLKKEKFHYDLWEKGIAPSTELREWFHQDPEGNWKEFVSRYKKELGNSEEMKDLEKIVKDHPVVTLLYGSKDEVHNQAVVLQEYLQSKSK